MHCIHCSSEFHTEPLACIPSHGGFPEVADHTGDWAVNTDTNSLEWKIEVISADSPTGTLEFHSSAEDAGQYFPVHVDFVSAQSVCEISVRIIHIKPSVCCLLT